jgi:hypothetical protein
MKIFRHIFLVISLTFIGCKETNTSNQGIYDFMNIVIKEQKLDKIYVKSITPRDSFNGLESDSVTFNKVLFKIQQKGQKEESADENEQYFSFDIDITNNL